jgi:hypothetical protein
VELLTDFDSQCCNAVLGSILPTALRLNRLDKQPSSYSPVFEINLFFPSPLCGAAFADFLIIKLRLCCCRCGPLSFSIDLGSFLFVDGKRERWIREHSDMVFSGRRRDSPLHADLFLARAGFVFLLEIACSICEWHLF